MTTFGPYHRYCPQCDRIRPYRKFGKPSSDSPKRNLRCVECSGVISLQQKRAKCDKALVKFGSAVSRGGVSVPDLREITGELIEQLGGIQKLVQRIVGAMDHAEYQDAKLFRDYCNMVMRLIEVENAKRMDQNELGELTDADLAFSLRRAAYQLLQEDSNFRSQVLHEAEQMEYLDMMYSDPAGE